MRRVSVLALVAALIGVVAATLAVVGIGSHDSRPHDAAELTAASDRKVDLERFDTATQWRRGTNAGTALSGGRLAFTKAIGTKTFSGRKYDAARWTSPWVSPGFSYTQLIASWSARTPGDSWIEVRVRGRSSSGKVTTYDVLGQWSSSDSYIKRRSVTGQSDDGTRVAVDTWRTAGLASYQLVVALHRRHGTTARPSLDAATVMTSLLPTTAGPTSEPGVASGHVLAVPTYSQMTHSGHFPKWGGGGEAWCSPTSVSMVLGYYGKLPSATETKWVGTGHTDPWVDFAARSSYDYAYQGTGNWPFSTAYAARAGKALVTRLRNLREAERLIRAGIPPVVSIAFKPGELTGTPIRSSAGHLLVIAGFEADGDVVVNDPAAPTRSGVRRVYNRAQFEKVWLQASGGLTYVINDAAHPLPNLGLGNW